MNMKMKRLVSMLLCLAMAVGLAACEPTGDEPSATPDQPGVSSTLESQNPEPSAQPERGRPGTNLGTPGSNLFYSDYNTMTEVYEAGLALNKEIAAEGYVLLKNEGSLPISDTKVSVFGKSSGSIAQALENSGFDINPTLKAFYADNGLSGEGRNTRNHSSFNATGETPQSQYTAAVKASYADYAGTAIVVFGRSGGEGSDLARASFATEEGQTTAVLAYPTREEIESGTWTPVGGQGRESDPFEHFLELDDHEEAILQMLQADDRFDNVIVLLDSTYAMEVGFLRDEQYSKVKSCLWITGGGANGYDVIGDILTGKINPSGRTPDILEADFTASPSWNDYANNFVGNEDGFDSAKGNEYTLADGTLYKDAFDLSYYTVTYKEGIYIGYHYYETRGYTDGEDWYNRSVVYPFGYGLSYTDFKWEVVGQTPNSGAELTQDGNISVQVKVTNTGSAAGKDVVQLYYEAPYTAGGIEKAKVELGDYAKTGLLQPGQSETVTLTINVRDMASYDYSDANGNGFTGYEAEEGNYNLYISKDSHSWASKETDVLTFTVPSGGFTYAEDEVTGNAVENRFDYINDEMNDRVLSRADWEGTWPQRPLWFDVTDDNTIDPLWAAHYRATHGGADWTAADTTVTPVYLKQGKAELVKDAAWLANFEMPLADKDNSLGGGSNDFTLDSSYDEANPRYGGGKAPWYSETAPSFRDEGNAYTAENPAPIQLSDMVGLAFNDPKWEEYLAQFTEKQAIEQIITAFNFVPNDGMGVPNSTHGDGPFGIQRAFDRIVYLQPGDMMEGDQLIKWCSQVTVAASFNKDLAYRYGKLNGDFGLWAKFTGWYSPGANIHRTPFSGRNTNYFSEDAFLSGTTLANMVKGCTEKGMVTFMKHYALNDQETDRDITGVATWADEQTMRQVYLRVFEMGVKDGGSLGMMSSFNRVGFDWAGASYELMTQIAREEWGFQGVFVTDAAGTNQAGNYMNHNMMIRAGQDISLDGVMGGYFIDQDDGTPDRVTGINSNDEANTATHLTALYDCLHRIQYVVANSAAMLNNHSIVPYEYSVYDTSYTNVRDTRGNADTSKEACHVFEVSKGAQAELDVHAENLSGVKYVLYAGNLEQLGLALDGDTGVISGTVSAEAAPGDYRITIGVCDGGVKDNEAWTANAVAYFYITVS